MMLKKSENIGRSLAAGLSLEREGGAVAGLFKQCLPRLRLLVGLSVVVTNRANRE